MRLIRRECDGRVDHVALGDHQVEQAALDLAEQDVADPGLTRGLRAATSPAAATDSRGDTTAPTNATAAGSDAAGVR